MSDIESMLEEITNSRQYLKYKEIGQILEKDTFIMNLMNEIKELQHESMILEYNNNPKYLELEDIIKEKVEILNNNDTYKLYLKSMREYNNIINNSEDLIHTYMSVI